MTIDDPRGVPGLRLWLSADYLSDFASNGDTLSSWSDLSGQSNHAFGYGSAKPKYFSTGGPGGGPRVNFGGSGAFALTTNLFAGMATTGGEMFVGMRSASSYCSPWALGQPGGAYEEHYSLSGRVYCHFGLVSDRPEYNPTIDISQWHRRNTMSGYVSSVKTWTDRLNEAVQFTSTTLGAIGFDTTTPLLGQGKHNSSGDLMFTGDIASFLIYDHALTTSQRADVIGWMTSNPAGGEQVVTPQGLPYLGANQLPVRYKSGSSWVDTQMRVKEGGVWVPIHNKP